MNFIRNNLFSPLIGICIILMLFSFITDFRTVKRRNALFTMTLSSMLLLFSDKITYMYNGTTGTKFYFIVRFTKFMAYAMFLVILYAYNKYLEDLYLNEGKFKEIPKKLKITEYIVGIGLTMLVTNQFTGIYYTFDSSNLYHRSQGYFLAYVFPLICMLLQISAIIQYRKSLRKNVVILLVIFTSTPILASFVQFFMHGVSVTSLTIVAMIVLLYCFSILDTNKQIKLAHKKEIELLKEKEENANIMLLQTSMALAEAIDAKDSYTNGHSNRVAEYAVMVAKVSGKSKEECQEINLIALLHDVGKIGIPNAIINKSGKLTDEEYETIKTHPVIGDSILSKISASPNLAIGAHYHHERYDGKGYPEGLKGEEIPEIARIIAVADSYDAMTSKRSYRDSMPQHIVRQEIEKGIGTQFDPKYAKIMLKLIDADKAYKLRQF